MRDLAKNIRLPSIDDLFSTEEERQDAKLEKIQILPLSELHPFEGHPFQVRDDEEMDKMVDSVKEYGVMTPAIVRPRRDGGYEIVAGHRRCHASRRAGVDTMPCIVRDMDDDTAIILMVDSNCQREHILPSEKAKAYEMKLEAVKRKAGRPSKNNLSQVGTNFRADEVVAQGAGESRNQVQRFIRLNKLTPDLMQLVDDGRLKTTPAVELSYLTPEEQEEFLSYMEEEGCTPSLSQAQKLKAASKESVLTKDKMQQLTGKDKDTLVNDLQGVIFADPLEKNSDGEPRYYTADEYLSGDVRHKLQVAKLAAQNNPAFAVNVQALETVQPKDLEASEIAVRLGATWLAPELIKQFADELVDAPYYVRDRVKVLYIPLTGVWNVTNKSFTGGNIKATVTYGTQRANFYHILEESLNLRDVRVFDTKEDMQGNKIRVLNAAATQEAQMKQQQIEDAFKDWIWKDPTRRQMLVKEYNERFNSLRPREYDGSHILFHGMSPEITLRPHQKNAIAHILYGGNTLLAHVVGAGKTYEMVAAAMEKKRLGLCSKTLICVPNHLTEQLAGEALQLYPNANILVARRTDFEKANRKRFCAKIATGNYDIIVIGHSQFERIPLSQERQVEYLQSQIHDVISQVAQLKEERAENFTVKQMERIKQ